MANVPLLQLDDGNSIPQLGFGTFKIPDEDTARAVSVALEVGYRHIDTAQMYRNEAGVGEAVRTSGLPREEIFVTSKLNNPYHRPDHAREAFDRSLDSLGFDYLDLVLIHWPLPMHYDGDFVSTWEVMEEFRQSGRVRSIGVSNFEIAHLQALADAGLSKPVVNQIEAHPYLRNDEVRAYCREQDILVQAWSPIAKGQVLADPVVVELARRVGRTPAQVVLRWHVQRGDIVLPKSVTDERVRENFAIFDFELDSEDMAAIDSLERGEEGRTGPHPDRMDRLNS